MRGNFQPKGFKKVAVGGSFDRLHEGHKALLSKAFEEGMEVLIGVSSNSIIKGKTLTQHIASFEDRVKNLKEFLEKKGWMDRAKIVMLEKPEGVLLDDPSIEALVVSEETLSRAEEINEARVLRGLRKLNIITIPMVKAEDGKPISSTRIRMGEIDEAGRLIKGR